MDLLARRYASPFVLLDEMAAQGRLYEFVREVNEINDEERLWDIWLHRVFDKTYDDWRDSLTHKAVEVEKFDAQSTVQNSFDILKGFNPE